MEILIIFKAMFLIGIMGLLTCLAGAKTVRNEEAQKILNNLFCLEIVLELLLFALIIILL